MFNLFINTIITYCIVVYMYMLDNAYLISATTLAMLFSFSAKCS